jgi:hypothetical protein
MPSAPLGAAFLEPELFIQLRRPVKAGEWTGCVARGPGKANQLFVGHPRKDCAKLFQ